MTHDTDVTVLGGRYLLTERIAAGGMGTVWRASDQVLGRTVAVKVLKQEYADDPTFLERFRAEARHTAALSHPGIAAVFDYGDASPDGPELPFLVMEYVAGEALSTTIARNGALSTDETLDVVGQAAAALGVAHAGGVIHRDIKPGNLLRCPDGTVKVTDFGIARAAGAVPLTLTGAIMGTAHYISPEQAAGSSVTPASDIYSLGVVAYECLTGRRPFPGDTPVSVALAQVRDEPPALPPSVPVSVRDLVLRMLAKEPAARPAGAKGLAHEAQALRSAGGATAPTGDALQRIAALPPVVEVSSRISSPPDATASTAFRRGDTDPGFRLEEDVTWRDRLPGPGWALPVAGAALAVLLVLVLVRAIAGPADDPGAGGTTAGAAAASDAFAVVARDLLGRPVVDVRRELLADGLRVRVTSRPGTGPVGTVSDVSPTGRVEQGALVTLTAVADGEGEGAGDEDTGSGNPDRPGKAPKGDGSHTGKPQKNQGVGDG